MEKLAEPIDLNGEDSAVFSIRNAIHHLCSALQVTERLGTANRVVELLQLAKAVELVAMSLRDGEPPEGL